MQLFPWTFFLLSIHGDRLLDQTETRLLRPSIPLAKHIAWFAATVACTSKSQEWGCRSCKLASKEAPDLIAPFASNVTTASGHVLVFEQQKSVYLSFGGTSTLKLAVLDAKLAKVPFLDMGVPGAEVTRGYLEALDSVTPLFMSILNNLQLKKNGYQVIITGVSLGGAMASLASVRVHHLLGVPYSRITVATFGQPRTGNEAYAQAFNKLPMSFARIVNYNDPVPHLPLPSLFGNTHHQNELFIDEDGSSRYCDSTILEDPTCSSSVSVFKSKIASHFRAWETGFHPKRAC